MASPSPRPKPPYLPDGWPLGGRPSVHTDVPITAVFLALFITAAALHMIIFQRNKREKHKFRLSLLMFGFSMARVVTCILRIASTAEPRDLSLSIAATVFTAAGVVLLYIVNLIFVQRMLRSAHPVFGWHPTTTAAFRVAYGVIAATIAAMITVVVHSFYTLDTVARRHDHDVVLYGVTLFTAMAFAPVPIILLCLRGPRDPFGSGSWHAKLAVLVLGSALVTFGAAYKAGVQWKGPVPLTQPLPGYLSRGAFYGSGFAVEVLVALGYAFSRVDRRFWVRDGAHGAGSYSVGRPAVRMEVDEGKRSSSAVRGSVHGSGEKSEAEGRQ
ncbi:hypothetical protein EJ06DRAFT_231794 [Trichodelitschia bisporula]|uniref:Uncharacterized protein n=1 Tax=Trichodelitschia bisporula TaxID=703511 RepID=A0A6G1HLG1_9PEZI|nr:hypothetical protein EJ06DRAFT_231794 [Trichodelitschia bisporula]